MNENDDREEDPDRPRYRDTEKIAPTEIRSALSKLQLFADDPYLRMQAVNIGLVDQFLMRLESDVLRKLIEEERTPIPESAFLSAQSQMWIFAAYEILRTWRQRAKEVLKWAESGGLEQKLKALEQNVGYQHFGRHYRAAQIKRVMNDPNLVNLIKDDIRRTHMLFARIEAIRVSLAKHEVKGRKHSVALMPGYGRINQFCGSLDYELENGAYSMGTISRRNIADGIRALLTPETPPTDEMIAEFDAFMRGPGPGFDPFQDSPAED